jgi:hypothetical protein
MNALAKVATRDVVDDRDELVTLHDGSRLEIIYTYLGPGDWIAQPDDNELCTRWGATKEDARDMVIEAVSEERGICEECRLGLICEVCDVEVMR